jgi:alpha-tubulin suppressor-like RCC1 family protein
LLTPPSSVASLLPAALLAWAISLEVRPALEQNSQLAPITVDSVSVSKGEEFACAVTSPGRVIYCWGHGEHGVLGRASTNSRAPLRITMPGDGRDSVIAVSAGATPFVCALRVSGQAYCWGQNDNGELGDGTLVSHRQPSRVRVPSPLAAISAGENTACGLTGDGVVYCWGTNEQGQLGVGDSSVHRLPIRVKTDLRFRQISVGAAGGVCAVTMNHQLACWGRNDGGQLGTADELTLLAPQITPLPKAGRFEAVSVGNPFACAITVTARVSCWGSPSEAIGARAPAMVSVVEVALPSTAPVISLSSGFESSCVLLSTQRVYCWGVQRTKAPIAITSDYAAISVGSAVCAITMERALDCWGSVPPASWNWASVVAKSDHVERIIFE